MALNLNAVMDAIGSRLQTINGLRVYDYAADATAVPAAIVALPQRVDYDSTAGGGVDQVVIPVMVLVGRVATRAARRQLADYVSSVGAGSIKAAIEGGGGNLGGSAQTVRVTNQDNDTVIVDGIEYLGASFECEVYA